jgi:GT2 family glycosyltransferase
MRDNANGVLACVLTRNESRHIRTCLDTLAWADGRLVVDCGSTDDTVRLAQASGAEVVTRAWDGWAGQRNFAVAEATRRGFRWIFFVDADERVPDGLRDEVLSCVETSDDADARGGVPTVGFWVPRRNVIVGKWIRHAGWDPDYQLRLFRTDRGHYDPARPIHELVILDGAEAHLSARLIHLNYDTWGQFWAKQRRYATTEAGARHHRGQRIRAHNFILQPLREFWRRYVTLNGWRSGFHGVALSFGMAAAEVVTLADHWRLAAAEPTKSPSSSDPAADHSAASPAQASPYSAVDKASPVAPPCDLAVVVVSYNVAPLLRECLDSIRDATAHAPFRVHTIVVDNASLDDSVGMSQTSSNTTVVANVANVGFGAACNQGFAIARVAGARHVLFLNPDARLEPQALMRLVDALDRAPHVGLVGPAVIGPEGSPHPPQRRFPSVVDLMIESTPLDWRGNGTSGRPWPFVGNRMAKYRAEDLSHRSRDIDWLSGSCLLVRADAFDAIGGFDPAFFLYFEETDLARRLDRAGWGRHFVADASVMHHGSRSASQDLRARDRCYYASKLTYTRRYHGYLGGAAVRASHANIFALEGAWQAIRGDPRAAARNFAVARQMLRSGQTDRCITPA